MKTLTVKQPWASLVVEGIKDIENRTWKCPDKYIGQRVLIHASVKPVGGLPCDALNSIQYANVFSLEKLDALNGVNGAIIGSVEIVGCVINHPSIWAEKTEVLTDKDGFPVYGEKTYNWILANHIMFLEPIPCKGKLSFWDYPNILAEPEEKGGKLFCHCQLPVKLENQVRPLGDGRYECRYCDGIWYR